MTGVVLIKTAVTIGVAEGWAAGLALIDPSVTNLMAAVVGGIVTIVMGWFAFKTTLASLNKKVDKQGEQIDQTLRKTEKIEGHVNSEKTAAEGRETALRKENALLRETIADKKETAALLAQAVATQPVAIVLPVPAATAAPVSEVSADPATLKQIEKHTSDTAENTARTDVKVQELKDKP